VAAPEGNWFIEYSSPYQAHMHAVKEYIYMGSTPYQKVQIVDTFTFGRCLILDGKIQSSEFDEYIYHEALVHPPMLLQSNPRKVLVIGGGEGAVVRELVKHPSLEKIVMVDIDEKVVNLCRKYLPTWHGGAFEDDRLEVIFADAREYLENCQSTFDVIIIDLTEPLDNGPSYLLFTCEFYTALKDRLSETGVLSLQAGSLSMALLDVHPPIRNTLHQCFQMVRSYQAFIPSFDTIWGFIVASSGVDNSDPLEVSVPEIDRKLKGLKGELKFYDGNTHQGIFHLPKNVRNAFKQDQRIIEDGKPLTVY